MFRDLQKLVVESLKRQLDHLYDRKYGLHASLAEMQEQLNNAELKQLHLASKPIQRFSWVERLVTRRKDYKQQKTDLAEYKQITQQIDNLEDQIAIDQAQVENTITAEGLDERIKTMQETIEVMKKATNLVELGYDPERAVTILEEHGIKPILDESDRKIYNWSCDYKNKSDLIAVHKMGVMPTGSRLTTPAENGAQKTEKWVLDGQPYQFSYPVADNTIHVSLNDEVTSHLKNFDHCQYTVLQPFAEIPQRQIIGVAPHDTFTRGGIDLTKNAWILCPAAEVEKVKAHNPRGHVVGYKGENSLGLAAPFLSQLGYRAEKVSPWGWKDEKSTDQFYQLMKSENLRVVQYRNSTNFEDEQLSFQLDKAINVLKMLRDQNLVKSPADYERLKPQIEKQNHGHLFAGVNLFQDSNVKHANLIDRDAIIANHRQLEYLIYKMADAGMPLSQGELDVLQKKTSGVFNATMLHEKHLSDQDLLEVVMVHRMIDSRQQTLEREF